MTTELQKRTRETSQLADRFISLANELKEEGKSAEMVNTALQIASGIYSTYLTAGNEGYLTSGGIEKITNVFKQNLSNIQALKKAQYNPEGKN